MFNIVDFGVAAGNAAVYPLDVTVANIDSTALIVSATTQMAGSTNQGSVAHMLIELRP